MRIPEGIAQLLRDMIHGHTGIFFEDNRLDILLEKLEPIAKEKGCTSFLEFYYSLKDGDQSDWDKTWESLSVQETYFWREMPQINVLASTVVPAWFSKRSTPFKIWSAASATGEEPYTIAIALAEAGFGSHPIEITASDASPAALEKAKTAIYREKSFRSIPFPLRQKYFKAVAGGWELSPAITNRVRFERANLFESADIARFSRGQAIFCRNVFIYFSQHAIRQTVAMMAARMPSKGILFVGASESLLRLTSDYELKEMGEALAYERL